MVSGRATSVGPAASTAHLVAKMEPIDTRHDESYMRAWNYFQYHASQRLSTFNFYVVICTLAATGYLAAIRSAQATPVGVVLGLSMCFLAFIFWKLDVRNRQMIENAERALKFMEARITGREVKAIPPVLRIFTSEEAQTNRAKEGRSFWSWKNFYGYAECFNLFFLLSGLLGFMAAYYAFSLVLMQ